MREKFTPEEFEKIEHLFYFAIGAKNKSEAQEYIRKLDHYNSLISGYSLSVYSEFISATKEASGQVSDKSRKIEIAKQLLYKVEMECIEKCIE